MKSFTLKFALLFLLGVGLASTAAAQKIGGVVKDSAGKPVIGASVVVDGTTLGASSGVNGRWTLTVPDASKKTLVISYIGMKTQRIAIGSKTQIDVRLEDESTAMDDVVVVGYATVKRRDVVGSVASVNAETLQQMPVASVAEAMTGRMAGVQVTATEGDPDAEIRIRVRGAGSFSSDGAPLYIVDGFPVESISDISSSEIQSIDILKDAFSTAIYGSRGANGVVLITTKSGEKGKVNVNYNVYWGFKDIARKNQVQALNPSEFARWQYELAAIQNKVSDNYEPYFGAFSDIDLYDGVKGNDWMDQLFGRSGEQFNHNLTVSGGGDAGTDYTMTLSATAGVLSSNITGLPTSWAAGDSTWTATDDTGTSAITFTGNIYYSTSDTKNIVWYFNKGKAETHVAASDMGKIRKITINPNSARKPELLTCTYGTSATVLAATEPTGTNSSTITFDFAAAGVDASDFRIGFSDTSTNIEIGKVVIEYTR